MAYMLTNDERETIINFNDAEGAAEIYTCNSRWIKRFNELIESHPNEVALIRSDEVSATYSFPKKWVKVRTPRILTDEQRKEMSLRAKERFGHQQNESGDEE